MATKYWIGGDWVNTNAWSLTSGGAGGAGVPTSADDVIFNNAGAGGNCSVGTTHRVCKNLTITTDAIINQLTSPNAAYGIQCQGGNINILKESDTLFSGQPIKFQTYGSGTVRFNSPCAAASLSLNVNSSAGAVVYLEGLDTLYRS